MIHGDSREELRALAADSIDACVCDPPYALVSIVKRFGGASAAPAKDRDGLYKRASAGFMGKQWDTGETAFDPAFWVEVLRVLKPGAHLVAFGGTRTFHRLVCAIEDAGFEVRDQLAWLFGSGFPKSHDVSKGIDKAAGAAPIATGEFKRASIQRNGAGDDWERGAFASHPEDTKRVEITAPATAAARQWQGWGTALKPAHEPIVLARKPLIGTVAANVLQHGTGALNIDACRVEGTPRTTHSDGNRVTTMAASGHLNGKKPHGPEPGAAARWPANVIHDGSEEVLAHFPESDGQQGDVRGTEPSEPLGANTYGRMKDRVAAAARLDSGSAARFFYTAKADAEDRLGSKHPTVKPVDLMAYLVRLVTPPGGVVLDPFAGSGTTGMACMREGFRAILIEREAEYVADIKRRLAHVRGEDTPLFSR